MVLPCCPWLIALALAAPAPAQAPRPAVVPAPTPTPTSSDEGQTDVAVLPLTVQGELPQRWYDEAGAKLVGGLSRGTLRVAAARYDGSCREPDCWRELATVADADFVVSAYLTVGDSRDYGLTIDILSARTGKVVASTEGACELCGFEEAVSMIETRAAVLAPEVARLGAVLPMLLFRSDPVGVVVSLDGHVHGPTPIRIQAPAGPHKVEATMAGFLPQTFEIEAVDGVRKEVELRLVPRPDDPPPRGRGMVIGGAVTAAAGVLGLAAGVTLLALDGRPFRRRCEPDANGTCQFDYETTIGGAVGASVGGAALATGGALVAAGVVRGKRVRSEVARISVAAGGLRVRF